MKIIILYILNYIIGFISDIILNLTNLIPELRPYFDNKSIIQAGHYAGLTIIISLSIIQIIYYIFYQKIIIQAGSKSVDLIRFLLFSAIIGYYIDIIIEEKEIFGESLYPYYNKYGSGIFGSIAILFTIIISLIIIEISYHFH